MSNKETNKIAGKHLGKTTSYNVTDTIDESLLVAIPRILNRKDYNIDNDKLPFIGFDVWNCYEVSTLLDNGYPVCGVLKIVYPSDSEFIVESKSLKLYLNSFNMCKLGANVNIARNRVVTRVEEALKNILNCDVGVGWCERSLSIPYPTKEDMFMKLETLIENYEQIDFSNYEEDKNILEVTKLDNNPFIVSTNVLRSNCRVTNQPDWGDVYIYINGPNTVTAESLLRYLISMRKENHFHEEICELIYKRLYDLLPQNKILVSCFYTRRGGIDINPIRSSHEYLITNYFNHVLNIYNYHDRTLRQ